MEEPASAEASITFCPFRADKRPAEGFGIVGLQRFAFVFPHAAREHTSVPLFIWASRASTAFLCLHSCLPVNLQRFGPIFPTRRAESAGFRRFAAKKRASASRYEGATGRLG